MPALPWWSIRQREIVRVWQDGKASPRFCQLVKAQVGRGHVGQPAPAAGDGAPLEIYDLAAATVLASGVLAHAVDAHHEALVLDGAGAQQRGPGG